MEKWKNWLETHITLHSHDSPREERLNALTHGAGALLSLIGLVLLLIKAGGDPSYSGAAVVFGGAMLLLYSSSCLYHLSPPSNRKRILRIMDHVNIYLLIAGTYTPICAAMGGPAGRTLLVLIWLIAAGGILFKLVFWGRVKPLHTIFYLLMGWMVVFFFQDLKASVPAALLPWMLAGGAVYSLGTVFYGLKKIPHYHAVWHLFVLMGSACMYLGIYLHIFPG